MKKFLIIGNINAITYKEIFPLLKENKIWLGHNSNKTMEFKLAPHYEKWSRIDEQGNKYGALGSITWYTNLNRTGPKNIKTLSKKYDPELYPKYDNYDAINVDKINDIPIDYGGAMGVPITFFAWDQYNAEFELLGLGVNRENFTPNKDYINPYQILKTGQKVNGGSINGVLVLTTKSKPQDRVYYVSDNSDYLIAPYARVLIKNKKVEFEVLGLDDHTLKYPEWRGRGPDLQGKTAYRRIIIKNRKAEK